MIHFDLPKEKSSIIKVIGIGGGGTNAVNYMYSQGIDGVNFIICNTDAQAIANSPVPNKIQLGPHLTQGLGAGANPEIGRQATEESFEEIKKILEVNTKMAFITAGMGGGTGTGGAPIIAKICQELGILTVGIVTTPFSYEGKKRLQQAEEGINRLKEHVDTLLIISNDKLRHQFGNLPFKAAFAKADNILATAAKCITDVINTTGQINVDFADVCTVMRNGGVAILGSAQAEGDNRAQKAIENALASPLLNDNNIRGAKWILLNITSAEGEYEHTIDEMDVIQAYIQSQAGENCDVILGVGYDPSLGTKLGVTIIATGFEQRPINPSRTLKEEPKEEPKITMVLGEPEAAAKLDQPVLLPEPADLMAPKLVETAAPQPADPPKELKVNEPERFALHIPAQEPPGCSPLSPSEQATVYSGGYLSKPATIYLEQSPADVPVSTPPANSSAHNEAEMKLVLKENAASEASAPPVLPVPAPLVNTIAVTIEETEEQKRKAAERLAKLRNISFNVKNLENNPEIETVPAYMRRGINLDDQQGTTDSLYSGYSVSEPKANNQVEISTINTFLDGKKPD